MTSMTQMHMDVVEDVKRHVVTHGLQSAIEYHPEEEHFPYIISYNSVADNARHGQILLFPQEDLYFTSTQLSFVIRHIRKMEGDGGRTLMVFSEGSFSRVRNILETTGVSNHAELAVFNKGKHRYNMQWSLD